MDLEKIKVPNNWVCVEYDNSNNYFDLGGEKMLLDTSYEPEKNAQTIGTVIKACDHVSFNPSSQNSYDYDVEVEIQKGDRVIFHFLTILSAIKHGKTFAQDGKLYVFMPYDRIFVAIRNDEIIPVNGFVLVRPDQEELPVPSSLNIVLTDLSKGSSKSSGTVVYAGVKCMGYAGAFKDLGEDPDVFVGQKVLFKKMDAIPLQYEFHSLLKEKLYRMQRKDILAIL